MKTKKGKSESFSKENTKRSNGVLSEEHWLLAAGAMQNGSAWRGFDWNNGCETDLTKMHLKAVNYDSKSTCLGAAPIWMPNIHSRGIKMLSGETNCQLNPLFSPYCKKNKQTKTTSGRPSFDGKQPNADYVSCKLSLFFIVKHPFSISFFSVLALLPDVLLFIFPPMTCPSCLCTFFPCISPNRFVSPQDGLHGLSP